MAANLQRIREPLAWSTIAVVLLAVAIPTVQGGVQLGLFVARDYAYWGLGLAAGLQLPLLAMTAAVALCWAAPALPRARLLTVVAACLATIVVGLPLIALLVVGLVEPLVRREIVPFILDLTPEVVLGIAALVVLWVLAGPSPREAGQAGQEEAPRAGGPELEPTDAADSTPPVWRRDEAAAAAWRTADDAAAGAPGTWEVTGPEEPGSPPATRG